MRAGALPAHPLLRLIARGSFAVGAFVYAVELFLLALDPLKHLPPTAALGVGRVTIEGASKTADYVGAVLFYLLVVLLTPLLMRAGERWFTRLIGAEAHRLSEGTRGVLAIVFSVPFWFAPMFHLTSAKELWGVLLPPLLGGGLCWLILQKKRTQWVRELTDGSVAGYHALVLAAATGWLLFRYLSKGALIAHKPTLFLEIVFIAFFLFAFVAAGMLIARLGRLLTGAPERRVFGIYAWALSPLILLPLAGLFLAPGGVASVVALTLGVVVAIGLSARRADPSPDVARRLVALLAWPFLLFAWSYASTAALSAWIDLFHRGEALGPASDYLRGRVPFRDVFVLHGMLENGLLDAWLMTLFGRSADVAMVRSVAIGSLTLPVLYGIGLVLFRSIPLALLTVGVGMVTFVDNQRIVFHLLVVLLLLLALRSGRAAFAFGSGALAGATLFYSLEIGLYSVATVIAAPLLVWLAGRRRILPLVGWSAAGVLAGVLPFAVWLVSEGVFSFFIETSFLTLPGLIDAVWSLPYPDLQERLRSDLSLRGLTNFLLGAEIRFILNPLVIAVALIVILVRRARGRTDLHWEMLLVVTVAALIAQRSALGRADFSHQYFAAYFIAPLIVFLAIAAVRRLRGSIVDGGSVAFSVLFAGVMLVLAAVALWVPDLIHAKLGATIRYAARLSGSGAEDAQARAVRERIDSVTAAVHRIVPPGEPIFDFSNQPALYFFTDRPNPTRFYQIPIASAPRFQAEIVERLKLARPRVVLRESPEAYDRFDQIENETRTPAVADWLDRHYEYRQTVRGIELWTPRATPIPPGQRHVPEDGVWSEGYLVFPAVASAEGAASSRWQSSLIAYNPGETPVPIRLRYLSTGGNREVGLDLPPRQTTLLEDLVRKTFGMPGTTGALLVRHPAKVRPIFTLETIDTTRPASLSVSQPLEWGAAADADGVFPTLTIAGLRGGDTRRVNLGLFNVGEGEVWYHISLRTPEGEVIGLPVQSGIHEGERFQLIDAEKPLGAPVTAGTVVHIRILKGRAIGYASVVDGATGASQTIPAVPSVYK